MSTKRNTAHTNAIDNAIAIIGDTHTLCIIHHLGKTGMRFNDLQRAINGLNPATLTARLKKLEREKIIIRKTETVDRVSVLYELTTKGKDLLPIIAEIGSFADKYL